MGANCVSCSDEPVSDSRRQEFDPAKHGSRSIFSPSPQEDFLQRQRSERKKHLKDRSTNQVTGAPAPLFEKRRTPLVVGSSSVRSRSTTTSVQASGGAPVALEADDAIARRSDSIDKGLPSRQVRNPAISNTGQSQAPSAAKKAKKNLFFMPET